VTASRTYIVLFVLVLLIGGGVYLASNNVVLRNLVGVIKHGRFMDRYAQIDTTQTDIGQAQDPFGRKASLLVSFFGLDEGLPQLSRLVLCKQSDGKDGMPVIFSHEIDPETIEPGDFDITLASGQKGRVDCLTMAPAYDLGELRTALLVGQFGGPDDPPIRTEITGNILSADHGVNFKGSSVAVTPLEDGPSLVWAEILPREKWKLDRKATALPWGGGTGCPSGTKQIVLATWGGSVTKPGGAPADDYERRLYRVSVLKANGDLVEMTPFALADVQDGDNNHKLCLDVADPALSVSFPAGHLTDPREDLNPDTSINISHPRGLTGTPTFKN